MKSRILVLALCLITFCLTACQNSDGEVVTYPIGELAVTKSVGNSIKDMSENDIIFSENDIKSFNTNTGEIILNNLTVEEIEKRINGYDSSLTYYIGETKLFNSIFIAPEWSSVIYNDLSLVIVDSKCYLLNGYPSLDVIKENKDEYKKIREKNNLNHKKNMDTFIRHLEKKGKIKK